MVSAPSVQIGKTVVLLVDRGRKQPKRFFAMQLRLVRIGEPRATIDAARKSGRVLAVNDIAHRYRRKSIPRLIADLAKQVAEEFD